MKNHNENFTSRIYKASILPDCLCGIVLLLYSVFIANIKFSSHFIFIFAVIGLICIAQFCAAPITNTFICNKCNKLIKKWNNSGLDLQERTALFKSLHAIPKIKQIECLIYFFFCSIILFSYYYFIMNVNLYICCASILACLLGSYVSGLLALSYSRRICTEYESKLVEEGIDSNILKSKKFFGTSYDKTFVEFCIIPVVWSFILFVYIFFVYYYNNEISEVGFTKAINQIGITKIQLPRIGLVLVTNTVVSIVSVYSFLKSILVSSQKLQNSLTHIIKNDIFTVDLTPTDFDNEVSYNIHLVNRVVLLFREVLDEIRSIGKTMIEPINMLSEISQTTASTSLEQSTGVKEILATMEDTDSQTRGIVDKIGDVTDVAEGTARNVQTGFSTLQSNLDQMNDITQANISTIQGIRELGEKIGSIWEIVKIINDIADQTRIIAFNAELEASSAGESGKNFHIVANEVRRLAAGITNSVEQIKDRITEIQHSSDNLIITSESGTEKIREGLELSEKLKEKFSDIQKSSEITVESALQIKDIIYQQSAAFDQIVATVRQISAGIENFSTSTNTVNDTAKKLQNAANNLENLHTTLVLNN